MARPKSIYTLKLSKEELDHIMGALVYIEQQLLHSSQAIQVQDPRWRSAFEKTIACGDYDIDAIRMQTVELQKMLYSAHGFQRAWIP